MAGHNTNGQANGTANCVIYSLIFEGKYEPGLLYTIGRSAKDYFSKLKQNPTVFVDRREGGAVDITLAAENEEAAYQILRKFSESCVKKYSGVLKSFYVRKKENVSADAADALNAEIGTLKEKVSCLERELKEKNEWADLCFAESEKNRQIAELLRTGYHAKFKELKTLLSAYIAQYAAQSQQEEAKLFFQQFESTLGHEPGIPESNGLSGLASIPSSVFCVAFNSKQKRKVLDCGQHIDDYIAALTAVSSKSLDLANIALDKINAETAPLSRKDLERFISATQKYFSEHWREHPDSDLCMFLDKFYSCLEPAELQQFSEESRASLQLINRNIAKNYSGNSVNEWLALSETAFDIFRKSGCGARKIGIAAHTFLLRMRTAIYAHESTEDRLGMISHSIDFCKLILDKETIKDTVTYANAWHFMAEFNFEKYLLTQSDEDIQSTNHYIHLAKSCVQKMTNERFIQEMEREISSLEERMNAGLNADQNSKSPDAHSMEPENAFSKSITTLLDEWGKLF